MFKAPATTAYVIVLLRETVRTDLMITTINDLEVRFTDILNAYVEAPVTEKGTTSGPEFSKDSSNTVVIIKAVYGLKSAVAVFRSYLASCIESMGYDSCKAETDLLPIPKKKQKMGYNNNPTYCVMWMTFLVSITMKMVHFGIYTFLSPFSHDMAVLIYTYVQSFTRPGYMMEFEH